jgi:hypothetical protein
LLKRRTTDLKIKTIGNERTPHKNPGTTVASIGVADVQPRQILKKKKKTIPDPYAVGNTMAAALTSHIPIKETLKNVAIEFNFPETKKSFFVA